jgi:Tfp pilus assembly protein PilN
MRAVNLLPNDAATQGRKPPPVPVIVACVGVVLISALLAVMYLGASGTVASKKKQLAQAQAAFAALPTPPAPPAIIGQLPTEKQQRVSALANVLGQRIAWDRLLRELSQVVPSDVWLLNIDAKSPAYAPPVTGPAALSQLPDGFILTGCTYSQDSVARFLARLELIPDLGDMTLGKSESQGDGGGSGSGGGSTGCPKRMFAFSLQGNVRAAGAAAS